MLGFMWWILIGFVIGTVAKWIMPGDENMGFIKTTLLGIGGSMAGGFVFGLLGMDGNVGFIGSVIGALLLLWLFNVMSKK
jgi:uncharacterized membrane protein YeaQ/YmgE (transglycosylase-associated protein family)